MPDGEQGPLWSLWFTGLEMQWLAARGENALSFQRFENTGSCVPDTLKVIEDTSLSTAGLTVLSQVHSPPGKATVGGLLARQ